MSVPGEAAPGGVEVAGVPLEFLLFGLTLLGVALFHHRTLEVALAGLAAIVAYKLAASGFHGVPGLAGLAQHLRLEWVVLANLFGLLMGFALLSRHFEESAVPRRLPDYLPDDWRGCFVLLVMVFVLSSFLDNIAAALIGGTVARTVLRDRVHLGYIAALVAASNAGGSGSVIGDTTTTMMWIDGVAARDVLHAYVAAGVALVVFGIPASLQQHRYAPIARGAAAGVRIDGARLAIVAFILLAAIVVNVITNLRFPGLAERFPFLGVAVWAALLLAAPAAAAGLVRAAGNAARDDLPAGAGALRLVDAGGAPAAGVVAYHARSRVRLGRVRQHPAHQARTHAGRLRLGHARVCGRLRRVDDLVRIVGGGGDHEPVSGRTVGGRMAQGGLARCACLRARLRRAAADPRLAAPWTLSAP